ncbi:ribonuclease HII [Pontiella agarivorans]|uniref:Ribonuclease HII n=1 Tax=Pontiella agarivorans TaxID=3038953 RepID=A0ABU5MSW1_9BACT|nr:ribonuclease HII [Pontiella agarivorans]MDZ8117217.1 ribonuclease HII [Pontiella agarivorans]
MKNPDVLLYEEEAWASGFLRLCGVDEAGRGPLAGPVAAAAVIFDPGYIRAELVPTFGKLTDSKMMSEKRREEFFQILEACDHARIGVGIIGPAEIDEINILKATHKAMGLAIKQVDADFALVDGLPVKGLPCGHRAIVKGDALSISISAASIIAKVTRDRMMVELDAQYPEYGFAGHKGYGTKKHLEALQRFGATPVHRQSFRPVAELRQGELFE